MTFTAENDRFAPSTAPALASPSNPGSSDSMRIAANLAGVASQHGHRAATYRESLKLIGTYFGSPYAVARVTLLDNVVHESFDATGTGGELWQGVVEDALLDCETQNLPLARRFRLDQKQQQEAAVLAVPIYDDADQRQGAMAIVVRSEGIAYAKRCLGELEALLTIISRRPVHSGASSLSQEPGNESTQRAIMKASGFESLHELAFAMTNSLKNKFGCSQVILAKVHKNQVRILSISGLDDIYAKSPGIQRARRAMEECLDCGTAICCQQTDRWSHQGMADGYLLHQRWREAMSGAPVASIPMRIDNRCVAVLAVTRPNDKPFSGEELRDIETTIAPFAPAIQLVSRADRSLRRHAIDAVIATAGWMLAPKSPGRKLIALACLLLASIFFFASVRYDVSLPCSVEPTETRRVSSPFDATIADCLVEAGDHVLAGQTLCRLDPSELLLQIDQAESELQAATLQLNQSLASGDVRSAAAAGAECNVIEAKLQLARRRLQQTELVAPCDGTILSGDGVQRVGELARMGDPLFEFVPDGDWAIELFAQESVVAEMKEGLAGNFSTNARPEETIGCVIEKISPKAEAREGATVYVIEGRIERNPDWLRSGMRGVAHLRVGKRPIWWIACHRLIDYAYRTVWF